MHCRDTGLRLIGLLLVAMLLGCEPTAQERANTVEILSQGAQTERQDFAAVVPGKTWQFPQDHLSHPAFKTEWWYLTANLTSPEGKTFGVQWTLFRFASRRTSEVGWHSPQMYMAHAVVTGEKQLWHAERFARGGIGQAGVAGDPFRAWLDNWSWRSESSHPFPGMLTFADENMVATLKVENQGELIFQGENGYSRKHPTEDIASYYYSAPFLQLSGTLVLDGQPYQVSGPGWLDREWSSEGLAQSQLGWDWFSLHLDDGSALMLYQIREKDSVPYYFGSRSWPDGRAVMLSPDDIRMTPIANARHEGKLYPVQWQVAVPSQNIQLKVDVVRKEQWLPFIFSYWEGPVWVSGSHTGQGFMELTGY